VPEVGTLGAASAPAHAKYQHPCGNAMSAIIPCYLAIFKRYSALSVCDSAEGRCTMPIKTIKHWGFRTRRVLRFWSSHFSVEGE